MNQRHDRRLSILAHAFIYAGTSGLLASSSLGAILQTPTQPSVYAGTNSSHNPDSDDAADELRTGTELTRQGRLTEAIPHLEAARLLRADRYAASVNLSICYLGLRRGAEAANVLYEVIRDGHDTPTVENLLTQALLWSGKPDDAWKTFEKAAALTPKDEKLYDYMADACTDLNNYALGLKMVETGLTHLPESARLHYERGLFLAELDRLDEGRAEFDSAAELAQGQYIGYLAQAQRQLYGMDYQGAIANLRLAIASGHRDYRLLSLLGDVLLKADASPGQSEFEEARSALEEAEREQPDFPATQLALGKLYAREDRFSDAKTHLEAARRLEPDNPAVYSNLAHVYRRLSMTKDAEAAEERLRSLLKQRKTNTYKPMGG